VPVPAPHAVPLPGPAPAHTTSLKADAPAAGGRMVGHAGIEPAAITHAGDTSAAI